MTNYTQAPVLFLDFDGTVSSRDAVDLILERFADGRWLEVEEEWRAGRIGSRECLSRQMALVRAAPRDLDALLASIELDAGLGALLDACARLDVPVHIISDGFDYCIRRILAGARDVRVGKLLRPVRVYSSHLAHAGEGRWRTEFHYFPKACAHGCATCKPAVMDLLNARTAATIFVGDGLSDAHAAHEADIVFAKKGLADFCRARGIWHTPFDDLAQVAARLEDVVSELSLLPRDERERVSA
jgi:2-hydroxy-3-keto-5-methylthiopentenyl-1-phosphate phosphatase